MTPTDRHSLLSYIAYYGDVTAYLTSLRRKAAAARTLKAKTALLRVELAINLIL
jgi:hypothetical protein